MVALMVRYMHVQNYTVIMYLQAEGLIYCLGLLDSLQTCFVVMATAMAVVGHTCVESSTV